MIDVLEHVDDDQTLLQSYVERAPRSASVLISVPAFQFLWSGHDVFLEHRRRYTRAQVEALVRRAGLRGRAQPVLFRDPVPARSRCMRLHDRRRLQNGQMAARSALTRQRPLANAVLTALHSLERVSLLAHQPAGRPVGALPRTAALRAALGKGPVSAHQEQRDRGHRDHQQDGAGVVPAQAVRDAVGDRRVQPQARRRRRP